jgi:ketosteroid isomerase-like protein
VSTPADTHTRLPLRAAMEAGDLAAALDAFAPDAVVRSPLTDRLAFRGQEQVEAILAVILDVFEGIRYTGELRSGSEAVLIARTRVGGKELEFVDHLHLDESGKITEFTVFFRPLPATAAALRLIGAGLGRRRGKARAAVISALARPLGVMTALGDRVGVALVRSTL